MFYQKKMMNTIIAPIPIHYAGCYYAPVHPLIPLVSKTDIRYFRLVTQISSVEKMKFIVEWASHV